MKRIYIFSFLVFVLACRNDSSISFEIESSVDINCESEINKFTLFQKTIKIFILAGQSNMEGFGEIENLDLSAFQLDRVSIFQAMSNEPGSLDAGNGIWAPLIAGHGHGFGFFNGFNSYSELFGLELSLGHGLSMKFPNSEIAFIKYARGGSSLDVNASQTGTWLNQNNTIQNTQTEILQKVVQNGLSSIDNYFGSIDIEKEIVGLVWLQGEADAFHSIESATNYYKNFEIMSQYIQEIVPLDSMNNVIISITDSGAINEDSLHLKYSPIVQSAQCAIGALENYCFYSPVELVEFKDSWHYTSQSYIDIGIGVSNCFY